jgi:hypothetical protein
MNIYIYMNENKNGKEKMNEESLKNEWVSE